MFPPKAMPDAANEEASEPPAGAAACPYCGKEIHLSKAPSPPSGPKTGPPRSNAAKMPMDQLKNVIKAGNP